MIDNELYKDFQKSLEAQRYCPIMVHNLSAVEIAKCFYKDYLTKEELCERQYTGRYWAIEMGEFPHIGEIYSLYILIDNKTFIRIDYERGAVSEYILDRNIVKELLPYELRGYYYD